MNNDLDLIAEGLHLDGKPELLDALRDLKYLQTATRNSRGICRSRRRQVSMLAPTLPNLPQIAHRMAELKAQWPVKVFNPDLRIPTAGLLPFCRSVLRVRRPDLDVRIAHHFAPLDTPSLDNRVHWPYLPEFIASNSLGLIAKPAGIPAAAVIADLALAFPKANIAILAAKMRCLKRVYRDLRSVADRRLARQVSLANAKSYISPSNEDRPRAIFLSTFPGYRESPVPWYDIVILLDGGEILQHRALQTFDLYTPFPCRLFGLCEDFTRLHAQLGEPLFGVYGFAALELLNSSNVRRDVNVVFLPHRQHKVTGSDATEIHLRGIVQNHCRNRRMAKLARWIVNTNRSGDGEFPEVAAWLREFGPVTPRVVVLVEQVLHAVALAKLLDFPILTDQSVDLHGLPGSIRTRLKTDRQRYCQTVGAIVVRSFARGFPDLRPNVVIWAGGGCYPPELPPTWLAANTPMDRLLIIDFCDELGKLPADWSHFRRTGYLESEMFERGLDRYCGRMYRFANRHGQF